MKPNEKKVILYAEDPGAANFVCAFLEPFRALGYQTLVFASGKSREQLQKQKELFTEVPENIGELLDQINPCQIIVGTSNNPNTPAHIFTHEGKKRSITTVGLVDSTSSSHLRFRGEKNDALFHAPDWIFIPDDITREKYISLGFPSDRLLICGFPHYGFVLKKHNEMQKEGRQAVRQRVLSERIKGDFIILFIADPLIRSDNEYGTSETFDGWGTTKERCEVALQELIYTCSKITPKPKIWVRPHSRSKLEAFEKYFVHVESIERDNDPLETVFAADLVIGLTSSLLFEAALMGKRSISIIVNEWEKRLIPSAVEERVITVSDNRSLHENIAKAIECGLKDTYNDLPLVYKSQSLVQPILKILNKL